MSGGWGWRGGAKLWPCDGMNTVEKVRWTRQIKDVIHIRLQTKVMNRDKGGLQSLRGYMGFVARKPVFRVSDKACFKPACSAAERI